MKCDIVVVGVGGQGILAVATIITKAAAKEGRHVRQSEIHGMSQRGGSVSAFVRLSDDPIVSDIILDASADIILSLEPLESIRYLSLLKAGGSLITAKDPVVNIPNYPEIESIYESIQVVEKNLILDLKKLAIASGSIKAANIVLLGGVSHYLPIQSSNIENTITEFFKTKGEGVVQTNLKAYKLGRDIM